jgi:hypothetical protein
MEDVKMIFTKKAFPIFLFVLSLIFIGFIKNINAMKEEKNHWEDIDNWEQVEKDANKNVELAIKNAKNSKITDSLEELIINCYGCAMIYAYLPSEDERETLVFFLKQTVKNILENNPWFKINDSSLIEEYATILSSSKKSKLNNNKNTLITIIKTFVDKKEEQKRKKNKHFFLKNFITSIVKIKVFFSNNNNNNNDKQKEEEEELQKLKQD